eukprot:jgi/Mesvir1/19788/Mv25380-RA.1
MKEFDAQMVRIRDLSGAEVRARFLQGLSRPLLREVKRQFSAYRFTDLPLKHVRQHLLRVADFFTTPSLPTSSRINNIILTPEEENSYVEELDICVTDLSALDVSHITCYHCKEVGHLKRECPKFLSGAPPHPDARPPRTPQRAPIRPNPGRIPSATPSRLNAVQTGSPGFPYDNQAPAPSSIPRDPPAVAFSPGSSSGLVPMDLGGRGNNRPVSRG